jgi:hypothetical protein
MAPRTVALQQVEGGRVKQDDLAPFAVADGLLARIAENPGRMSEREIDYLVDQARTVLARSTGETLKDAGRVMEKALDEGGLTIQCGRQFAVVTLYGRLLVVLTRAELAGACHPERN